jgi:RNA polymerase sigma-70 factor (ECF subfamily)
MLDTENERQTFSELYDRMNLKCLHIARKITIDHSLAEDAVHNAFLKIIEKKDRYFSLPCYQQDALIVTIVKHKAIDIVRTIQKPTVDIDELDREVVSDNVDVSLVYENAESYEGLRGLIRALPEIYRVVFEMRYIQDFTNAEIGDFLDITKETVAMRLMRARARLKKMLQEAKK